MDGGILSIVFPRNENCRHYLTEEDSMATALEWRGLFLTRDCRLSIRILIGIRGLTDAAPAGCDAFI